VNIAARLEGLAEPGGISVSGTVHEQVRHRLELGYEDLGEQEVKNIPDPVRVLRVQVETAPAAVSAGRKPRRLAPVAGVFLLLMTVAAAALWALREHEAPVEDTVATEGGAGSAADEDRYTVPGFGGRPAIAVLAFDNLSGDPDQEYFADGIAENLITRLSALRNFPVIARNSSFVYKGKAVDVKQVSRELGARYVVEGSFQKAGERVRINAQLIDAATGHHLWAKTYDRELRDIFTLQDEITQSIVGSMEPELTQSEMERASQSEPKNLDAYDLVMRGFWHLLRGTKEDSARARALFERAAQLDPEYAPAFFGIAMTHNNDLGNQWTGSPARSAVEWAQAAKRCVELDDRLHHCYIARGLSYAWSGPWEKAIADLELAVRLNPSSALGYLWLGNVLATHRPDGAIETLEKGLRLSPQDPFKWAYMQSIAQAHFAAGRYREAIDWAKRSLQLRPEEEYASRVLAAAYAQLGFIDQAQAALDDWLGFHPGLSIAYVRQTYWGTVNPEYLKRILDGLRKAGLPEE